MKSDCPHTVLVSQFVDNELSDQERSFLDEHFAQCSDCSDELERMRKLRSTLSSAIYADPSTKQQIYDVVSSRARRRRLLSGRLSIPLPVAAALLMAFAASVIGNAYWGFFRAAHERIVYKETRLPDVVGGSAGKIPANKGSGDAADAMNSRTVKAYQPGHSNVRPHPGPAVPRDPGAFAARIQTDRYATEFMTAVEYRLYAIPKIYAGGVNFSEQR